MSDKLTENFKIFGLDWKQKSSFD